MLDRACSDDFNDLSSILAVGITLGATTFPFLAVVALVNPPSGGTKPAVVARIEGN